MGSADFLAAAAVAADQLRAPVLARRWSEPSALADFSVAGLACHLAHQVTRTVGVLSKEPGGEPVPVPEHYRRRGWVQQDVDGSDNVAIRRSAEEAATQTDPADLADEVEAAARRCAELLTDLPPGHTIAMSDYSLSVDGYLQTRTLELVVHSDDLAVSLGEPTPPMPEAVVQATVGLLAVLAVQRHGGVPVVRALSRRERAPESISAF